MERIRNLVLDFIPYFVTAYIEEVSKTTYDKQFIAVTTHKNYTITVKNVHKFYLYTGIWYMHQNIELLKLYSKEKTIFFLLNKVATY